MYLPATAPNAVVSWRSIAFLRDTPDCSKMAKSPISWGTSCSKIVMVVTMPRKLHMLLQKKIQNLLLLMSKYKKKSPS